MDEGNPQAQAERGERPAGSAAAEDPGDAALLDWFLALTPERRLAWNQAWVRLVVELRHGLRER